MAKYTSFSNTARCPGCHGVLDQGTYDQWACTRCGDEWDPATLYAVVFDGVLPVGVGDTLVFKRLRQPVKGEIVKVNKKTVRVRLTDIGFGPIDPPLTSTITVKPERVFAVVHGGSTE